MINELSCDSPWRESPPLVRWDEHYTKASREGKAVGTATTSSPLQPQCPSLPPLTKQANKMVKKVTHKQLRIPYYKTNKQKMVAKSHRRNWYWNPGCTKSPGCRVVQVLGLAPGTQHYRRRSTEDCLCAEAVGARVCEGNYEKDWREGPKSKENEEYRYKIKHCSSDIHLSQGRGSNIFASCEVTSSLRTSGDLGEGDERAREDGVCMWGLGVSRLHGCRKRQSLRHLATKPRKWNLPEKIRWRPLPRLLVPTTAAKGLAGDLPCLV